MTAGAGNFCVARAFPRVAQGSHSSTPHNLTLPTKNSVPTSSFSLTPLVTRFRRAKDRSELRACSAQKDSISSASMSVRFCPGCLNTPKFLSPTMPSPARTLTRPQSSCGAPRSGLIKIRSTNRGGSWSNVTGGVSASKNLLGDGGFPMASHCARRGSASGEWYPLKEVTAAWSIISLRLIVRGRCSLLGAALGRFSIRRCEHASSHGAR